MIEALADVPDDAADDAHFATRLPKHPITDTLVNVIDRHRAEVEAEAGSSAGK